MTEAIQLQPQALNRGRSIVFTPERMQQITNLVERGKSRDEIAEIIGVTTDTLQVACSKLGLSLRRRTFDIGTGLRLPSYRRAPPASPYRERTMPEPAKGPQPLSMGKPIGEKAKAATPSKEARQGRSDDPASAVLAIRMNYKNEERSTGLPLDQAIISQLVVEAEIRGMRIGELFAALILAIMKKDLFQSLIAPRAYSDEVGQGFRAKAAACTD
jgi:hypothetical protein